MQVKQNTIGDIVDSERTMVLTAAERYGQYYDHAFQCSVFLTHFLKSIDPDRYVFGGFLSHIKKHHTLALFSTVRLHKVQAMMNLRQVLEAGACAAYAIANPNHEDFVDTDQHGLLDPSPKLATKRYKWLEQNFPAGSATIKEMKDGINVSTAHANLLTTHNTFRPNYEDGWFSAPFFDVEDEHLIKTDLWLIGQVALTLLDLFYGVSAPLNVIKFVDDFQPRFTELVQKNLALRAEMMSTDRYKRAIAKQNASQAQ